jgi:hypothetical protein
MDVSRSLLAALAAAWALMATPARGDDGGDPPQRVAEQIRRDAEHERSLRERRVWLGVLASFDLGFLSSANNVCRLSTPTGSNPGGSVISGYYCTDNNGTPFPTTSSPTQNGSISTTSGDQVQGGAVLTDPRVMLSADFALTSNFLIGARIGYVFGTYPAANGAPRLQPPLHVEARGTLLLGSSPLSNGGPMFFVAAGASEFDAYASNVPVDFNDQTPERSERAWSVHGGGFVAAGGGWRFVIAERYAIVPEIKFSAAGIGSSVTPVISPGIGLQLGL